MTAAKRDDVVGAVALAGLNASSAELAVAFGYKENDHYLLDLHRQMTENLARFICKLDLGYRKAFIDMAINRQGIRS